jgi:hypothetical protein
MNWLVVDENASDICYRNLMGDSDWARDARVYFSYLYGVSAGLLDKNYLAELKANLHSRFAEVYFAAVCRDRLKLKISHPSDKGLDFYLDEFNCWVECVTPGSGKEGSVNSIPCNEPGISYQFPERQFMLRMASSVKAKSEKALSDISKGIVKVDQPILLFVSAGGLKDGCLAYPHPKLFNVLCGLGDLNLFFESKKSDVILAQYESSLVVEKIGADELIDIGYFFNEQYAHISAVFYSWANFANPRSPSEIGRDIHILHNPNATNKLPFGFFPCGREFYVKEDLGCFSVVTYKVHDPDPT